MKMSAKIAACGLTLGLLAGCVTTDTATNNTDSFGKSSPPLATQVTLAERAAANRDYLTAATHYKKLYDKVPGDISYLLGTAKNLRYGGLADQSVKLLVDHEKAWGHDPDYLLERAKNQIALGNNDQAIDDLEKVMAIRPADWDVYMSMGIAHDHAGRFRQGQKAYAKALMYSPNNAFVLNNLAMSKAQTGRLSEAISIMEEAARRNRKSPQIRQNLAFLYGLNGEIDKAEKLAIMDLDRKRVENNLAFYAQVSNKLATKKVH